MKRVFTIAIILFSVFSVRAQQDAQFSQNMFLNNAINPGATGIKGMHCFNLVSREQWVGFEGSPFTGLLSYNGPINTLDNVGIGAVVVYDKIGFEQNVSFKLTGAYHLPLGAGKLGLGLDLGLIQKNFSGVVKAQDISDPTILNINGSKARGFDLGFGVFYHVPNRLYFGISGQKLIPQQLTLNNANSKLKQHVYITGGYYYPVTPKIVLKPNMLIKTDLSSTQMDLNITLEFNQAFWIGTSYRVQDAIVANVGFQFKNKLKIGLAYDFTTQNLRNEGIFTSWDNAGEPIEKRDNRSLGSVEVYLGYCFVSPPKPIFKQYVDPLFL
tara:strand:+ start:2516 stop:3493 length:978 start_codon:yes stop_codon:yes gene_type:complete